MTDDNDFFAQEALQRKKLLEHLAVCRIADVVGVVDPSGAVGSRFQGDDLWTLRFTFDAWRMEGANLETRCLTVHRKVTDEDLHALQESIAPYTVLRIRARVSQDPSLASPHALLESLIGLDTSDAELSRHAEHLQEPVIYEDSVFGTLVLDRRIGWYTATIVWNGAKVELHLPVGDRANLADALRTAHTLFRDQRSWDQRIRDYAVAALLPLKNESWLGEDEIEISADEFRSRMSLESITAHADGSFEFWHTDGELFWGHSIQISGSLAGGPTYADIPG